MKATVWPGQRRVRVVASAAAVATRVETMVAVMEILSVVSAASWKPSLWMALCIPVEAEAAPARHQHAAVEGEDR